MTMMGDLSQAEIDALLAGAGGDSNSDSSGGDASIDSGNTDELLSPIEKDALGEIGNISMGSAATTLSTLLGHKVSITTPSVTVAPMNVIQQHYPLPYLVVEVAYTVGIDGNNVFAIQATDAAVIADLMMGGDGTNPDSELNEIHLSAVGEAMNQMMGAVATSLSTMFNKKIDISPPKVNLVDFGKEDLSDKNNTEPVVRAAFRMEVDGLIDSEIMQIITLKVAKEMVDSLMGGNDEPEPEPAPAPTPPTPKQSASAICPCSSCASTKLFTASAVARICATATELWIWGKSNAAKCCNKYARVARAVHAPFHRAGTNQRGEYRINFGCAVASDSRAWTNQKDNQGNS